MEKTLHKADCKRVFKNYDMTCPRCLELKNGSRPREGWSDEKRRMEAERIRSIKNHDCKKSGCSVICTFGDW